MREGANGRARRESFSRNQLAGEDSDELSVSGDKVSDDTGDPKAADQTEDGDEDSSDKKKRIIPPKKQKPGKLPETYKKAMQDNSRDAADDALKRFFSGR